MLSIKSWRCHWFSSSWWQDSHLNPGILAPLMLFILVWLQKPSFKSSSFIIVYGPQSHHIKYSQMCCLRPECGVFQIWQKVKLDPSSFSCCLVCVLQVLSSPHVWDPASAPPLSLATIAFEMVKVMVVAERPLYPYLLSQSPRTSARCEIVRKPI